MARNHLLTWGTGKWLQAFLCITWEAPINLTNLKELQEAIQTTRHLHKDSTNTDF